MTTTLGGHRCPEHGAHCCGAGCCCSDLHQPRLPEPPAAIDWFSPATMRGLADVGTERLRQDELHPGPDGFNQRLGLAILVEEVGEVAKAKLECDVADSASVAIAKRDELRTELVQVAASAVRWIECIDDEVERNARAGMIGAGERR